MNGSTMLNDKLNIVVLGLWHLGSVTSACCSQYYNVLGVDFDDGIVNNLNKGLAPLFEPNLNELILSGLENKTLAFTSNVSDIKNVDVLWITYDTDVDENDESDVESVLKNIDGVLKCIPNTLVIISSQLPVGTCLKLEIKYPNHNFVSIPENLRLGKSIESFEKPDRIVIGVRSDSYNCLLSELLHPFSSNIIFMKTESAEMTKHAINSFLALSIVFINEIASLCESVGANASEVSIGLKSEVRIGKKSYLKPGGPFAGGTLARDVVSLMNLDKDDSIPLITSIKRSNDVHKKWPIKKLNSLFSSLKDKNVVILGISYTDMTDTLRRSDAIELYEYFRGCGSDVSILDPMICRLPKEYDHIKLIEKISNTVDIIVVYTERTFFKQIKWDIVLPKNKSIVVIDVNGFLKSELQSISNIKYFSFGDSK